MYIAQYKLNSTVVNQVALTTLESSATSGWPEVGELIWKVLQKNSPIGLSCRLWHEHDTLKRLLLIQNLDSSNNLPDIVSKIVEVSGCRYRPVSSREEFDDVIFDLPSTLAISDPRPFHIGNAKVSFPHWLLPQFTSLRTSEENRNQLCIQVNTEIRQLPPELMRRIRHQGERNRHLADLPNEILDYQDHLVKKIGSPMGIAEEVVGAPDPKVLRSFNKSILRHVPDIIGEQISDFDLVDSSDQILCKEGMTTGKLQLVSHQTEPFALVGHLFSEKVINDYLGFSEVSIGRADIERGKFDVFISYSSEDVNKALAIVHYLEEHGIGCWIAPRDVIPGRNYTEEIMRAIEASPMMILLFSVTSDTSPHVRREVERAVSRGLAILPVRLENTAMSPGMEYLIAGCQWLDVIEKPLECYLVRLRDAVSKILEFIRN